MWWVVATLELHAFLARRPARFALAAAAAGGGASDAPLSPRSDALAARAALLRRSTVRLEGDV